MYAMLLWQHYHWKGTHVHCNEASVTVKAGESFYTEEHCEEKPLGGHLVEINCHTDITVQPYKGKMEASDIP